MQSITKVLAITAMLPGFIRAAPYNTMRRGSDDPHGLAPRDWPSEQQYSTTEYTTTTPASCFSTSKTTGSCSASTKPPKTIVSSTTSTPMVPKTSTLCETETLCYEKVAMVPGSPTVLKHTSTVWMPPPPRITTSHSTIYSTSTTSVKVIKLHGTSTETSCSSPTILKPMTTPVKFYTQSEAPWYSVPQTSVWTPVTKAVTPSNNATYSSSQASKTSSHSIKEWTMPTHSKIPEMSGSGSTFGGTSNVLGAVAPVALAMAAF